MSWDYKCIEISKEKWKGMKSRESVKISKEGTELTKVYLETVGKKEI